MINKKTELSTVKINRLRLLLIVSISSANRQIGAIA